MMRTRFYLEMRRDPSGRMQTYQCPVFMSVSFHGNRLMLGTGLKVDRHGWCPEIQRVRKDYPGAVESNQWLDSLKEAALKTWRMLESENERPDPQAFRKIFHRSKPAYTPGFFQSFFHFMEQGSPSWSISTYRKVRTTYTHLRRFEDESGYHLTFKTINEAFLSAFESHYRKKGKSPATVRSAVNILVWFLNWATDRGYNMYRDYRRFYGMLGSSEIKKAMPPVLCWEELMELCRLAPENRRMERARDLFCFMCFSGVRFSEMQSLKKEDVDDKWIRVRKKGGRVRQLPMNRFTREIYGRYKNRFYLENAAFPRMSLITMNKYLRLLGGKIHSDKRMTAGMAVHTFIANALELEIPAGIISEFTGVKQDSRIRHIRSLLAEKEMEKFDELH